MNNEQSEEAEIVENSLNADVQTPVAQEPKVEHSSECDTDNNAEQQDEQKATS